MPAPTGCSALGPRPSCSPGGGRSPERKRCWIRLRHARCSGIGWDPLGGMAATSGGGPTSGCLVLARAGVVRATGPTLPSRIVREAWAAFDGEPDPGDGGDGARPRRAVVPGLACALRTGGWRMCLAPTRFPTPGTPTGAPTPARLLVLESQGFGDELVRQRRALRDISPCFFGTYRGSSSRLERGRRDASTSSR